MFGGQEHPMVQLADDGLQGVADRAEIHHALVFVQRAPNLGGHAVAVPVQPLAQTARQGNEVARRENQFVAGDANVEHGYFFLASSDFFLRLVRFLLRVGRFLLGLAGLLLGLGGFLHFFLGLGHELGHVGGGQDEVAGCPGRRARRACLAVVRLLGLDALADDAHDLALSVEHRHAQRRRRCMR